MRAGRGTTVWRGLDETHNTSPREVFAAFDHLDQYALARQCASHENDLTATAQRVAAGHHRDRDQLQPFTDHIRDATPGLRSADGSPLLDRPVGAPGRLRSSG